MAQARKYEVEDSELKEKRNHGPPRTRKVQTSWPTGREKKCWIMLIGDCFFTNIFQNFEEGGLLETDWPFIIAVYGGKISDVIDYAKDKIPPSVRMIVVHLGANNLASRYSAQEAKEALIKSWKEICKVQKDLEEVSFCLLTPRVTKGSYPKDYIEGFNKEVLVFNKKIVKNEASDSLFSFIDFGTTEEDVTPLLGVTGFGPAKEGKKVIADCLQSLIKFKVNTSTNCGVLPDRLTQPAGGVKRKAVVIREKEGMKFGFYHMPKRQLRLSLERDSREIYPDTEVPEFEDDFIIGKKRKAYPAEGLKPIKRTNSER